MDRVSDPRLAAAIAVMRANEEKWKAGRVPGVCGLTLQDWISVLDELLQRRELSLSSESGKQ